MGVCYYIPVKVYLANCNRGSSNKEPSPCFNSLLLFLSSFHPEQPKSYRTIDLVHLSYLRNWDVPIYSH